MNEAIWRSAECGLCMKLGEEYRRNKHQLGTHSAIGYDPIIQRVKVIFRDSGMGKWRLHTSKIL